MSEGMLEMPLRVQPWKKSNHNTPGDYYYFRENPELIRTNLEEFYPYNKYDGVQKFYDLVEWLNGANSEFETNDARLMEHLTTNHQRHLANKPLLSIGVLGFFFRDLRLNLSNESSTWFRKWETHEIDLDGFLIGPNDYYQNFSKRFIKVVERTSGNTWPQIIGLGTAPVHYDLAQVAAPWKYGCQFMMRFWLWGDNEREIFDGLHNVVKILKISLEKAVPNIEPEPYSFLNAKE